MLFMTIENSVDYIRVGIAVVRAVLPLVPGCYPQASAVQKYEEVNHEVCIILTEVVRITGDAVKAFACGASILEVIVCRLRECPEVRDEKGNRLSRHGK